MKRLLVALLTLPCFAQIPTSVASTVPSVGSTIQINASYTQATLSYPSSLSPCTIKVADMQRQITISSGTQATGTVTITTTAPHGLLTGAVVRIENSGVSAWDGWQTLTAGSGTSFTFASATSGTSTGGNVGVLVDDVNTTLVSGSNSDSRAGSYTDSNRTVFVLGHRDSKVDSNNFYHSRALQAYARHHVSLTCSGTTYEQEFNTGNIPVGDTFNPGIPIDTAVPGNYAYPTIQWNNIGQALIDPFSGILSRRITGPAGTASSSTAFVTAIDIQGSAWVNPSQAISGGAATFTPPCGSGTCPLFLRADGLTISGGSSYTPINTGMSLDWFQPAPTLSISNGSCTGDDCKVSACLTVNGQTCSSGTKDFTLTTTPTATNMGTTTVMDLWQSSGPPTISRPDATEFAGTVNYNSSTKVVTWASGNYFDLNWTAGSRIKISGTEYPIASITNEASLTLSSGPGSNLTGATYGASNFGVLIWKKTSNTGIISISNSAYKYGSSSVPTWPAGAIDACSSASPAIVVGGKNGFNCFIGQEMFWVAADGSAVNDLGFTQTNFTSLTNYTWGTGLNAAPNAGGGQFDPQNGDCWYTSWGMHYGATLVASGGVIMQVCYEGNHAPVTNGTITPDCAANGGTHPCLQFTNMMPLLANTVPNSGTAFNPAYATSGATFNFPLISTIDPTTSTIFVTAQTQIDGQGGGQDWPGWIFAYALGNRSPMGTPGGMSVVGAISTYLVAPLSYCTIHNTGDTPFGGWAQVSSNNMADEEPTYGTYTMTFSGGQASLTAATGGAGGLNACPVNSLGATGVNCTTITVTTQPTHTSDSAIQNLQLADLTRIDSEAMRVIAINSTSPLQFVVQRGYGDTSVAAHSGTTLTMICGTLSSGGAKQGLWNYTNDPLGSNTSLTTITNDPTILGGHHYIAPVAIGAVSVGAAGAQYNLGIGTCPTSATQDCTQARIGNLYTASTQPSYGIATGPEFDGIQGMAPGFGGGGNAVDSHPGPCFNFTCFDAHPLDGGLASGDLTTGEPFLGTSGNPYTLVTGQLWKFVGANTTLHRKILPTFAYVGRKALVDVSGPSSAIPSNSSGQYTYCYANVANECVSGSSIGDVYVNAPYVQFPWCWYPGIANQPDDVTSICIGDLGAHTASLIEYTVPAANNWVGTTTRRLGPNLAHWNQFDVFQNVAAGPSLTFFGNYARWLDGVRNDALFGTVPPMPVADGINRTTFESIPVNLTPPGGMSIATALVEFGYGDYGAATSYYCTTRQESCVSVASSIGGTPFWYETSDSGSFSRAACASSCTIALPALSGHVLYANVKYYTSGGTLVTSQALAPQVIP